MSWFDVETHGQDEVRYGEYRARISDLCDLCKHDVVVEGYDECRGCLTELEAELDEIEERVEGTA